MSQTLNIITHEEKPFKYIFAPSVFSQKIKTSDKLLELWISSYAG